MTNKSVVILALFAGLQLAGASFYTENEAVLKYHWDTFKEEHSRFFDDEKEESRRFEIFKSNLKLIDERNFKEGGRATHGV
mmetsp:Transcript_51217/g.116429  ORF Transcript_51217/g.116429 Transcript_51217/m.116429 type:complete len:81 (+) Transcript_51217:111-353(+)